jgi:hypothetical protein
MSPGKPHYLPRTDDRKGFKRPHSTPALLTGEEKGA